MDKPIEFSPTKHPSAETLDRLRAGLYDEDNATRDRLRRHVETCRSCQEQIALWPRVIEALDGAGGDRRLANSLSLRRHRALRSVALQRPRRRYLAFGLAAAVTALGIGLGTLLLKSGTEDADVSAVTADAPSPDLYADLDFYLWLMHKHANVDTSPNS